MAAAATGTRAGVGRSRNLDARAAGREAALAAVEALGGRSPSLVIVFAAMGYAPGPLLEAISEVTSGCPMTGCSGEGVITRGGSEEVSCVVGVMAIASEVLTFRTLLATDLSVDPAACGRRLADAIAEAGGDPKLLLLFPDGVTGNCAAMLNALEARLPLPLATAGGTAGDLMEFKRTLQFHDGRAATDAVAAVVVHGPVTAEIAVSHGCERVGREHTITRAEGEVVLELDGRPAWEVLREYLDLPADGPGGVDWSYLSFAERLPAALSSEYGDCIMRSAMGVDAATGGVRFATALPQGSRMQMALRNPERISEGLRHVARQMSERFAGRKPLLMLQFDCAHRGRLLFGRRVNELSVEPAQALFGETVPWLGMHTFGEIAPIAQRSYLHNYTVVLCGLFEEPR